MLWLFCLPLLGSLFLFAYYAYAFRVVLVFAVLKCQLDEGLPRLVPPWEARHMMDMTLVVLGFGDSRTWHGRWSRGGVEQVHNGPFPKGPACARSTTPVVPTECSQCRKYELLLLLSELGFIS